VIRVPQEIGEERYSGKLGNPFTMSFTFKWKHKDGSIVELSESGWRAEDPKRSARLRKMSSYSVLTRAMKVWLQKNCKPVDSVESNRLSFPTSFPEKRRSQVDRPTKVASRPNDSISPTPNERNPSGRKGNGKTMATKRCIDAACDEFFRSRGIQLTEGFNSWKKVRSMEESMDEDDQWPLA
jgi:hypothetical protein